MVPDEATRKANSAHSAEMRNFVRERCAAPGCDIDTSFVAFCNVGRSGHQPADISSVNRREDAVPADQTDLKTRARTERTEKILTHDEAGDRCSVDRRQPYQ